MRLARASTRLALTMTLLLPLPLTASIVSDFQARFAQTIWAAQQTEAILRALPQSASAVSTPEGLSSYAALLAENTAALNALATVGISTDEQRRALARGLQAVASALHDQSALAANRGLSGLVSNLSSLEESCRSTLAQMGAGGRR
ncbi:MAG: hypothetical protein LC796_02585 [Acidobacteria bacterium]|nr:hypothetical protein [Acidobacteriota bacterium]MCA1611033.1 hypothetical protein [Acidobacteriota bacterium]